MNVHVWIVETWSQSLARGGKRGGGGTYEIDSGTGNGWLSYMDCCLLKQSHYLRQIVRVVAWRGAYMYPTLPYSYLSTEYSSVHPNKQYITEHRKRGTRALRSRWRDLAMDSKINRC